jgi:hypothetical protein
MTFAIPPRDILHDSALYGVNDRALEHTSPAWYRLPNPNRSLGNLGRYAHDAGRHEPQTGRRLVWPKHADAHAVAYVTHFAFFPRSAKPCPTM